MPHPLVSIIVNNFNYARFLAEAIDSALAQTHPSVEVVVVDDGSTDDSREVIATYGDRIRTVLKTNGGQGSAYNAGFAVASGEWILMLDSDDTLNPDCVAECLAVVEPGTSKVQFRLACRTERGVSRASTPFTLHSGDVKATIAAFGTYAGPPGSGNLYRRTAIERAFPMPEPDWRGGADTVPFVFAGLAGRIVSIERPLGTYRLHRASGSRAGVFGNMNASIGAAVATELERRRAVSGFVQERLGFSADTFRLHPPTLIRNVALAHRLGERADPAPFGALRDAPDALRESLAKWGGYSRCQRVLHRLALRALLHAPGLAVRPLARLVASGALRRAAMA